MTAVDPDGSGITIRDAMDRFLSSPRCANPNTRRAYAAALDKLADRLGPHRRLPSISEQEVGDGLAALWGTAAESTWNQRRAAAGSFLTWCRKNCM
ncbi:hypothetical protein GCM10009839_87850 [Catenulispora yoronensis]|uniref:Core-binding (CB) domain-containing protein n=1 Tax=Catenulispora yoronensis TaxID=450799 RepID=A0ABP5H1Y9_9ACTN